jgi:hypothetical protein
MLVALLRNQPGKTIRHFFREPGRQHDGSSTASGDEAKDEPAAVGEEVNGGHIEVEPNPAILTYL